MEPLFEHPPRDYKLLDQVIVQSEKAGFKWGYDPEDSLEEYVEHRLEFYPFPEEIFYHDFAVAFFQCHQKNSHFKHLQEMVTYTNPFDYLEKHLRPLAQIEHIPLFYADYPPPDEGTATHMPEQDYKIMEGVIIKSKQGGYKWVQEQPHDTPGSFSYWLLRLRRFPFNIFTHDFAESFFQCEKHEDNLKHLQEMVICTNPFEYLQKFI